MRTFNAVPMGYSEEELKEIARQANQMKSGWVNTINTYFTGPFLFWLSFNKSLGSAEKKILTILGLSITVQNWNEYKKLLS